MLSHEPKNYALLGYDGTLVMRGVAFRSSRSERFGDTFLRAALRPLLGGDLEAVRGAYLATVEALRTRALPTLDVSSRVRLTRSPQDYLASRDTRRELPYEAMLSSGRTMWTVGERVRVYRRANGQGGLADDPDDEEAVGRDRPVDARDYDGEHYVRVLRHTFAARFVRALTPADFSVVFADPDQPSLFSAPVDGIRTILTPERA